MNRTALIAGLAVLVLACGDRPTPTELPNAVVAADLDVHERQNISGTTFHPCTGEAIAYEGRRHFFIDSDPDGAGGFHVKVHVNYNLSATGLSTGRRYRLRAQQNLNINARPPFPFAGTAVVNVRWVAQGQGDDFVAKQRVHITVDANGNVRAEFFEFESECT